MSGQWLAFVFFFASTVAGTALERQSPADMVRLLQDVQTQVANGAKGGQETLQALLSEMDAQFAAMDDVQWRDPRNARALALYVMSGGRPEVAQRALAAGVTPQSEQALLRGAAAQAEARVEEARKHFDSLDPRAFDPALGAHVAFAKANVASDKAQARALLELARLLAPGGLIEEAALRRSVFLAGESGDVESFIDLSRRYSRRFRGSAYFGNFAQGFASSTEKISVAQLEANLDSIDSVVALLPIEAHTTSRLDLARRALLDGRNAMAARLSRAALVGLGASDQTARMRSALYAAASKVGGPQHREAQNGLTAIVADGLSQDDRNLLMAARAGARHTPPRSGDARMTTGSSTLVETATRARKLLEETAGLIGGAAP